MRPFAAAIAALCVTGCATLAQHDFDQRYGKPNPTRYDVVAKPEAGMSYRRDVQPIVERRCVVCHACYDGPCQLKLTAWEGIARGTSKAAVYDAARLREAPTTRLFLDAQLPSQWWERGFSPVLNNRTATPETNLAASVLYRSLQLKREHPLPTAPILTKAFDFSLDRKATCPRVDEYENYAANQPLAGMPYGLPGLDERELSTIQRWIAAGAPYEGDLPLSPAVQEQIRSWETFLNGDSNKERLMSRYLYEHLYLGTLYFESDTQRRPLRLIRSASAPGKPAVPIATRRAYDDPGVARVYYRLVPERETIVAKTHMPYVLSGARMAKYRGWFLDPAYMVAALPSYDADVSSNPFAAFHDLPIDGRYRFLLDEAEYFVMNFIKGPVCRGQLALDVIEDRFWVFFVDPDAGDDAMVAELLARERSNLRLPAEWGSTSLALIPWIEYSKLETNYLRAKSEWLERNAVGRKDDLSMIWSGDGRNPNATLTVFRHFDSATVVKGLVGEPPKTAWVIGYPLFERIYYLLVAGYDVYGNAGHQLNSRLYMDFLRMEGEFNFLVLLPEKARHSTAEYWYRGAPKEVTDYVYGRDAYFNRPSGLTYRTSDPQRELYDMLSARVAPVAAKRFDLSTVADPALRRDLQALSRVRGASLAWMPEVVFLRIEQPAASPQYFSVLRNTAHKNVAHLFKEELLPAENTVTVVPGFLGAYPNAIFSVKAADLPALANAIGSMASEDDYRKLADRYAVRRTHPRFWATSDELIEAYAAWAPAEAGIFDYSRLENR
jgi:Fatty acid cis/trans isomerase (CTI)